MADCNTTIEEWRTIKGLEDYSVSSLGRVRRDVNAPWRGLGNGKAGKILMASPSDNGYRRVCLWKNGKNHWRYVHRLVAIAFIGQPPKSRNTVNHRDGNRLNNHHENLEWVSPAENVHHCISVLRQGMPINAKLTAEHVRTIRSKKANGIRTVILAKEYNVSESLIRQIVARIIWCNI